MCVDYYSKFVEIRKLNGKTAKSVQIMLLAIFAVHGIPEAVIADNMAVTDNMAVQQQRI